MSQILTRDQIKTPGWYWLADRTETGAEWEPVYVEEDPDCDESEYPWAYGDSKEFVCDPLEEYHVLIGPIEKPSVPVPFERLTRVIDLKVPVVVPTLQRIVKLNPYGGSGSTSD